MNTSRLLRILKRRCRGTLLVIFPSDRIPRNLPRRRPLLLVCNTDPQHKPGEHWIVIYVGTESTGEYFDSYGQEPPPVFRTFLDKHCVNGWIRNELQMQSAISRFCGHYCVFYCLFKMMNYNMQSIVDCFSNDTMLNDTVVHKFVCENL